MDKPEFVRSGATNDRRDAEPGSPRLPLRNMRRQYGLSQFDLADLLGVAQSTVSRWESGAEEIGLRRRRELLDLFSNRDGRFDRLIQWMIRELPYVTIFSGNRELLHATRPLTNLHRVEPQDIIGRRATDLIDLEWERKVFGGAPNEDILMADHVHDLVGRGQFDGRILRMGLNNRRYRIHFDGYREIVFNHMTPIPKHQNPRLVTMVRVTDLDDL